MTFREIVCVLLWCNWMALIALSFVLAIHFWQ